MKFDLTQFNPCEDGLIFYDNYDSFEDAWNACARGDWMLWIAARLKVDYRILILAKSRCARTVIHLMEDERSMNAVEVSELYGLGKASKEELMKADKGAKDAYIASASASASGYTASASYAAAAASASSSDSFYSASAYDAAVAAFYSASAAYTSSASAGYAATAKSNNERQTADICREILTESVFKQINQFFL
jgi:hypothetical protein